MIFFDRPPTRFDSLARLSRRLIWIFVAASVQAQNWPSFRGPEATGILETRGVPISWDVEKNRNVAWRTPIPGLGHWSPNRMGRSHLRH